MLIVSLTFSHNYKVIKTIISSFVKDHKDWDKDLAKYVCAIRTAVHEVIGKTPYFLNYGKKMCLSGENHLLVLEGNSEVPDVSRLDESERLGTLNKIRRATKRTKIVII